MADYPVGTSEQLLGVVNSAHSLLQELSAAQLTLASYKETVAVYQQKVTDSEAHIQELMDSLASVSDVYVTTYLGWNPKTDTPPTA